MNEELKDEIETLQSVYSNSELSIDDADKRSIHITYISKLENYAAINVKFRVSNECSISVTNNTNTKENKIIPSDILRKIQKKLMQKYKEEKDSMPIYQCISFCNDELLEDEELNLSQKLKQIATVKPKNKEKGIEVEVEKYRKNLKKKHHKTKKNKNKIGKRKNNKKSKRKQLSEKQNAKKLYNMYQTVYFSKTQTKHEITLIINDMIPFISRNKSNYLAKNEEKDEENYDNGQCKVCYCSSNDDENLVLVSMFNYCSHCMICENCFIQYVTITIKQDENILPWILCPANNCKAPIHKDILLKYIDISYLYKFCLSFINKHLIRTSYYIECPDKNDSKCKFGWIHVSEDNNYKTTTLKCKGCGCNHNIEEEKDDGFQKLIDEGIMRECPKCSYPAMKDYGMCNVMHCGKCGIYWNWRTKEMGTSTNQVKNKARANGSLWEPGELAYQQNLQRNNLTEFIALLKKNGIKYDPNYRRGS